MNIIIVGCGQVGQNLAEQFNRMQATCVFSLGNVMGGSFQKAAGH